MTTQKVYTVKNPRGIRPGIRILVFRQGNDTPSDVSYEWFEGDDFIKPPEMKEEKVDDLILKGFLELKGPAKKR